MRIWFRLLRSISSDYFLLLRVLGAGSKFHKSKWYKALQGNRKFDLFAEPNETVHGHQRRLVSRVYSMDTIKHLEPYVNATITHFIERMHGFQGKEMDMGKWLQLFAFGKRRRYVFVCFWTGQLMNWSGGIFLMVDVIGEITFARRFGFMDALQDDGIFDKIQNSVRSGVWLAHVPWILHLHNFLMPVIGNHLAINDRNGTIRDYTIKEVQNRFDRGSDRPDILGKLFDIHKEKPEEMDFTSIVSVASSNVGAGSDTTAISLRAMIFYLLKYPEKKALLLEEIDEAARAHGIGGIFTFDQAREMPYLQAVMHEAMRLYPAIGATLPRITPQEGLLIGDKFIPGGVQICSTVVIK